MCGFAGILQRHSVPAAQQTRAILEQMGQRIAHRGPDDSQIMTEGQVGLVFRRLSIVDVAGGEQPMTNEDGSLVLVVNGEIYNHLQLRTLLKEKHTFKSRSDSEIILHLYEEMGEGFLSHLNGMFALALWDKKAHKIVIARDRLGIKPLYYHISKKHILFGSEMKALFAHPECPREVDWHAGLSSSLNKPNSAVPLPTFFKNIHYLKGGERLQFDLRADTIDIAPYWVLPQPTAEETAGDSRSAKQIISGYHDLLAESVELQLMSDVGMGIFLSGGIDSVSIAQVVSTLTKMPTFTVLSQSTFQNGDVQAAATAARHFNLDNHQVVFQWYDDLYDGDYWKRLLWHLETPLCSAEQLYKYELHRYAKHQFPELKCMLLGQGSDEFNGGYAEMYVGSDATSQKGGDNKWDLFMESLSEIENRHFLQGANAGLTDYAHLLNKSYLADNVRQDAQSHPWRYHASMYTRALQVYNLWHEDRTASAHGIESRVPFLDHRLVEYTMRVPPAHYKALFWNKEILRKGFEGHIPHELLRRPKVPFFYGDDVRFTYRMLYNMLTKNNRRLIYEALGEPDQPHSVIDRQALERYIDNLGADVEYAGLPTLLTLVNLGLLEKMAAENGFSQPAGGEAVVAERMVIQDFEQDKDSIALRLGVRRDALTTGQKLMLSENVTILTDQQGTTYLAVDGVLEYSLEEPDLKDWVQVLKSFDGHRTLDDILQQLNVGESDIRVNLEEALDYGILKFG